MSESSTQPQYLRSILIYHLPFLLFAAAILMVSRIPNLKSPDLRILPFDKLAHFGEYSIFAFLTFRSFSHVGRPNHLVTAMVTSILFIAAFAGFDEYSQRFVQGRVSDPMDFVTDLAGAVLVVLFFWLRAWRKGREERP